jgi:hypothetical protein
MTISAKQRRQITVDGESYLWWVTESIEEDFVGTGEFQDSCRLS